MKLGILSDIHGDLSALDVALSILKSNRVDQIVCAGDVAGKGDQQQAVIDRLIQDQIPCVKGNHDQRAARRSNRASGTAASDSATLSDTAVRWLDELPLTIDLALGDTICQLTHAIPSNNAGWVFHQTQLNRLSDPFKKDVAGLSCSLMIVGHTHQPYDVTYQGLRILNPGSVCKYKPSDSQTVAILDTTSSLYEVISLVTSEPLDVYRSEVH